MIAKALQALNTQFLLKLQTVIPHYHTCNPSVQGPNPYALLRAPAWTEKMAPRVQTWKRARGQDQ